MIAGRRVDVIHEVSPSKEQADISELCNQIQGLGDGAGKDEASPFNVAVPGGRGGFPVSQHTVQVHTTHVNHQTGEFVLMQNSIKLRYMYNL